MFNVMKAQTYQLLRSNGTYIAFLAGLGVAAFSGAIMLMDGTTGGQLEGSVWLYVNGSAMPVILPVLALTFVIMICGGDMDDKTINYEVLNGKKRSQVYIGRVIVSLITSLLCCLATLALPLLGITAVKGWGHTSTVSDVALRIAAAMFPIARLTALFILAMFLFRSKTAVAVLGYLLTMLEMGVSLFVGELFSDSVLLDQLSTNMIQRILVPTNFGIDYIDGKDVTVVKDVLELSTVGAAAISGLAGMAVFLLLGYLVFRRQDMN